MHLPPQARAAYRLATHHRAATSLTTVLEEFKAKKSIKQIAAIWRRNGSAEAHISAQLQAQLQAELDAEVDWRHLGRIRRMGPRDDVVWSKSREETRKKVYPKPIDVATFM